MMWTSLGRTKHFLGAFLQSPQEEFIIFVGYLETFLGKAFFQYFERKWQFFCNSSIDLKCNHWVSKGYPRSMKVKNYSKLRKKSRHERTMGMLRTSSGCPWDVLWSVLRLPMEALCKCPGILSGRWNASSVY